MASGILGRADLSATTETIVYTTPAGKTSSCTVSICNRSTSDPVKVRIAVTDLSTMTANSSPISVKALRALMRRGFYPTFSPRRYQSSRDFAKFSRCTSASIRFKRCRGIVKACTIRTNHAKNTTRRRSTRRSSCAQRYAHLRTLQHIPFNAHRCIQPDHKRVAKQCDMHAKN